MNGDRLRAYRFSTAAQWQTCLVVQGDRVAAGSGVALRPFAPYEREGTRHATAGAYAPVTTRAGEILWRDGDGRVHRLWPDADAASPHPAPSALAGAARIVSTAGGLWTHATGPERLQRFDPDSLARVLTADVAGRIRDIAGDRLKALYVLTKRGRRTAAVRLDAAGGSASEIEFTGIVGARAFVYLRTSSRFVVLGGSRTHQRLYWFNAAGGPPRQSAPVAALAEAPLLGEPCFTATALGSDSRDRVFVALANGKRAYVLILDADGNEIGDVPLTEPATGVTASRDSLLVTSRGGLTRFKSASVVPEGAGELSFQVFTPMLFSPDREDQRRWLRVEAAASLPEGSTLEIAFASTDDSEIRDRMRKVAADEAIPATERARTLWAQPGVTWAATLFRGSTARGAAGAAPVGAKLFDVRDHHLWVAVTLRAAAGAPLPALSELSVFYPGRSLMEHLPSIYRRAEEERRERSSSFVRDLVGVLETTTQGLDRRIASMAGHIHPSTARGEWLDYIARWLGLPWDDTLGEEQKRRIVMRAPDISRARGTRLGLEAFLEALMPGTPRRFRIADTTADYGFAIAGGTCCGGSTLPAMLGGYTAWRNELGTRSVLGDMRLPCPDQIEDGVWQLTGRIRIDIAATAAERRAWEPWLAGAIDGMVPVGARVSLRWTSTHALQSDRLDGTLTLDGPPSPHLGTDAITNLARLPETGTRLSASGPGISRRLR